MSQSSDLIQSAQRTIRLEVEAVQGLLPHIDADFVRACEMILASKGRVVVVGMGKSGHIGNKIAATLASTGTTAFFVHPAEASHGDMGMITRDDIILALSNSGSTNEIITLLPLIKRLGIQLISMTGNPDSPLAKAAEVNLNVHVEHEACPLNLAPTSSTTAALVMGDALAVALLDARGFTAEDFAFSHPGWRTGPTPVAESRKCHACRTRVAAGPARHTAQGRAHGNDPQGPGHDRDPGSRRQAGRDLH
jgi:arabinose-5-phosphate isomerase